MPLASIITADFAPSATGRYGRIFGIVVIVIADWARLSSGRREKFLNFFSDLPPPKHF